MSTICQRARPDIEYAKRYALLVIGSTPCVPQGEHLTLAVGRGPGPRFSPSVTRLSLGSTGYCSRTFMAAVSLPAGLTRFPQLGQRAAPSPTTTTALSQDGQCVVQRRVVVPSFRVWASCIAPYRTSAVPQRRGPQRILQPAWQKGVRRSARLARSAPTASIERFVQSMTRRSVERSLTRPGTPPVPTRDRGSRRYACRR